VFPATSRTAKMSACHRRIKGPLQRLFFLGEHESTRQPSGSGSGSEQQQGPTTLTLHATPRSNEGEDEDRLTCNFSRLLERRNDRRVVDHQTPLLSRPVADGPPILDPSSSSSPDSKFAHQRAVLSLLPLKIPPQNHFHPSYQDCHDSSKWIN